MERTRIRYRRREQELESKLAEGGRRRDLPPPLAFLVLAAAAAAAGRRESTRAVLGVALRHGIEADLLREAILETYLFAGYPRAINALTLLQELQPRDRAEDVDLAPRPGEVERWAEVGPALCQRVYGKRYSKLLLTMGRLSPDLARWMVLEGYGKVLSRPGLSAVEREWIAVAALVPLDVPEQLRAHLRGSLQVGASPAAVAEVLAVVGILEPRRARRASRLLESLISRTPPDSADP